jgi:uncharacterized protein YyaL (SSP411 family)
MGGINFLLILSELKKIHLIKWTIYLFILAAISCKSSPNTSQNMEKQNHPYSNALMHETSPYLLQHAHNPVNWMPWGPEALAKAKAENKMILVSVGYAACHWCHVMEHESFEDTSVAKIMNENYVCIKVDREERPDIDQVYMNAVQLITGRGGWPLNCFTLPDGRPIYGGTYFPKKQWIQVLQGLQETYTQKPEELEKYASQLKEGLQQINRIAPIENNEPFKESVVHEMVLNWSRGFDDKLGGNNYSPKFPMPNNYLFLLRYGWLFRQQQALNHATFTLKKMAFGGIYDQVGGGFARYSTDAHWKVPHFEKMLYDNAQLIAVYAEAYQATKDPLFKDIVYETIAFIDRELKDDEGGYYSSLDADSEGVEGKFYIWTKEELKALLSPSDFEICTEYYSINAKGKWEHDSYILLRSKEDAEISESLNLSKNELEEAIQRIKSFLLEARAKRMRPGLDDKILTSWNALMISGLCDVSRIMADPDLQKEAEKQMAFLLEKQWRKDGGLNHNYKKGKSNINGYLEDYALVIEALIKLYEVSFDESYLEKANQLVDYTIEHFYNSSTDMFFFTSNEDDPLVSRTYETSDNVIPASNSVMARNLFYLGELFYNESWLEISKNMLKRIEEQMYKHATSYSNWGLLMLHHVLPYYEVVITGEKTFSFYKDFEKYYQPNRLRMGAFETSELPLIQGKFGDQTTVFICENKTCKLPVYSIEEAIKQMR